MKASDVLASQQFVDRWFPRLFVTTDKYGAGKVSGFDPAFLIYDETPSFDLDACRYFVNHYGLNTTYKKELMTTTSYPVLTDSEVYSKRAEAAKAQELRAAERKALEAKIAARSSSAKDTVDAKRADEVDEASSLLEDASEIRRYLAANAFTTVNSIDVTYSGTVVYASDFEVEDERSKLNGVAAPTEIERKERAVYALFSAQWTDALNALARGLESLAAEILAKPTAN